MSCPLLGFFLQGNLRYWLEEAECRDQYSVIFESGDRTSIFWNDVKDPVSIEERAVSVAALRGLPLYVLNGELGTRGGERPLLPDRPSPQRPSLFRF